MPTLREPFLEGRQGPQMVQFWVRHQQEVILGEAAALSFLVLGSHHTNQSKESK